MLKATIIVALILMGGSAFSQQPPPSEGISTQPQQPKAEQPQAPAATNQQPATQTPIIVNIPPAQKTEAEAEAERHERQEKAELDRRLVELTGDLAFFTAALFYATGGLVFATIIMAVFAGLQSRDMKASIAASEKAANAADSASQTAERALVAVERAFVSVSSTGAYGIITPAGIVGYEIHINVDNAGRTPARQYNSHHNLAVFDKLPEDFRFPDRPPLRERRTTIGQQTGIFMKVDLLIAEAIAIYQKQKRALIYGWMEYDDIFPDSERHRTEFCFELEISIDPSQQIIIQGGKGFSVIMFTPYGPYNSNDQDCMYRPGQTPLAVDGELPPLEPIPAEHTGTA